MTPLKSRLSIKTKFKKKTGENKKKFKKYDPLCILKSVLQNSNYS